MHNQQIINLPHYQVFTNILPVIYKNIECELRRGEICGTVLSTANL
jgi:hypothetical protein